MREMLLRTFVAAILPAFFLGAVSCGEETEPPTDNQPPVIHEGLMFGGGEIVEAGQAVEVRVGSVSDADNDPLVYTFSAQRGTVEPSGPLADPVATYTAPDTPGEDTLTVRVSDARGGVATSSLRFSVVVAVEPSPPSDGAVTKITGPVEGAVVPSEITVKGTTSGLDVGSSIWTVVHHGGLFWPQRQALVVKDTWTADAFIGGGPRDSGKQFDVIAVLADSEVNSAFVGWIERGQQTGEFPGLPALPPTAIIADRVTVTLE